MTSIPRHVPVAVVGGGQAGLSVSYHLKQRGIDHLVFEKEDRRTHLVRRNAGIRSASSRRIGSATCRAIATTVRTRMVHEEGRDRRLPQGFRG